MALLEAEEPKRLVSDTPAKKKLEGPVISQDVNRDSDEDVAYSSLKLSWESDDSALAQADEHDLDAIVEEQKQQTNDVQKLQQLAAIAFLQSSGVHLSSP